ncbi:MAG: DUF2062 domain-containing protein, partial [Methyloceanibacter sp.]
MLFKRRETEGFFGKLRVHLWPRRSWNRSSRYVVHRLRRLKATPHAIALGFAVGVFWAVTPFFGVHLALAVTLAWFMGASIVAAILGTFAGNPLTYPLFWYSTYELGTLMLGGESEHHPIDLSAGVFQGSLEQILPIIVPMSLGAIPIGIALAALC